ncbi:MAG TPA: HAD family phosphatase [Solirubrobacteraceae bacterium]|nr:HAD family phosphatase [Solirubrobacteraceae bacterium]
MVDAVGIRTVIFDLDGVLIDSEERWARAKEDLVRETGGRWKPEASHAMLGMSSPEWSRYLQEELGVPLAPEEINDAVVARMLEDYRRDLPLIAGARDAVQRLAARWPLALASSSNREVIDVVLQASGLADAFDATVSSEEVARGKPAPDVYLEAATRLGVAPGDAAAVEDSTNALLAALAAGMAVVATPNRAFPPSDDALAAADVVLGSISELTPATIESLRD